MNSRIVAALVLAPMACALVFGAWLLWGLERQLQDHTFLFVAFLPGLLYGAMFEVLLLLPLLALLRRVGWSGRGVLVAFGIALWAAAALLNMWATSELSLAQYSVRDMAMVLLPLLVPGVALVLVFVFVAQSGEAA